MHAYISKNIISFLFKYYYVYVLKLYDSEPIDTTEEFTTHLERKKKRYQEILDRHSIWLSPPSLVYLQFYLFPLFFYYLTHSHYWGTVFCAHAFHICRLSIKNIAQQMDYTHRPFLELSKYLYYCMMYLFCLHGMIADISFYKKVFFSMTCIPFYLLSTVRYTYKKRLASIQNNTLAEQNILIFTSDQEKIKEIYAYTQYFTFSTFLWVFTIVYRICID